MFRAARAAAFARINNYASPRNKEVFKIRVDMRAGETRLIKSKLQVTANPKMTDSLVVVGHRLVCRPMKLGSVKGVPIMVHKQEMILRTE